MKHYTVTTEGKLFGTVQTFTSLGEALGYYDEQTRKYASDTSVKVSERVLTNEVIFTAQKDGQSVEIKLTIWA